MADTVCIIECDQCQQRFASPLRFMSAKAFFTSYLVDHELLCPKCRQMTRCGREHLYFTDADGRSFRGSDIQPT